MKFTFFPNTNDGNHCVQACMQTVFAYFGMQVPSLDELDKISGHIPGQYTWMTKLLMYLAEEKNLFVTHTENLDYAQFATKGTQYLKTIWDEQTLAVQDQYSDLAQEQKDATKLTECRRVRLRNMRLNLGEIARLWNSYGERQSQTPSFKFVFLLSVNPNILYKTGTEYSSHMVVITKFNNKTVQICDPNRGITTVLHNDLGDAINPLNKPDFSLTVIRNI